MYPKQQKHIRSVPDLFLVHRGCSPQEKKGCPRETSGLHCHLGSWAFPTWSFSPWNFSLGWSSWCLHRPFGICINVKWTSRDLVSRSQIAFFSFVWGRGKRVRYNDNRNPVQAFTSFQWALIDEALNFITLLTSGARTFHISNGKQEDTKLKRIGFRFKLALKDRHLS